MSGLRSRWPRDRRKSRRVPHRVPHRPGRLCPIVRDAGGSLTRAAMYLCAALALGFSFPAVADAGWYPQRPLYDYSIQGTGDCGDPSNPAADHGRCGPLDGPVFNSFINTPSYGFEPAFLDARRTQETQAGAHGDPLYGVNVGDSVTLRVYVNNNANENFGERTTAAGTRVTIATPTGSAAALRVRATIHADNAVPADVEDTVDLVGGEPFRLEYIPGSARLYTDAGGPYRLSDSIAEETGALIGYGAMNGVFKAGFDRDAVVQLEVRARAAHASNQTALILIASGLGLFVVCGALLLPRLRFGAVSGTKATWDLVRSRPVLEQVAAILIGAALLGIFAILVNLAFA